MKKPIIILLVLFFISFFWTLFACFFIADQTDKMMKSAIENAPKYMGMNGDERVYLNEKEMKLEFKE